MVQALTIPDCSNFLKQKLNHYGIRKIQQKALRRNIQQFG